MNNIGGILFDRGQYEGAAEQYLKALQIKQDDTEILSNLGNTLTKLKDYQNAWLAFEEALKLSPANIPIIENYLLCLLESKQLDKFEELVEKLNFLPKEVKERVNLLADEYRITLGIKAKKQMLKRQTTKGTELTKRRTSVMESTASPKKSGTLVADSRAIAKRMSFIGAPGHLQSVEEEKDEDPDVLLANAHSKK